MIIQSYYTLGITHSKRFSTLAAWEYVKTMLTNPYDVHLNAIAAVNAPKNIDFDTIIPRSSRSLNKYPVLKKEIYKLLQL